MSPTATVKPMLLAKAVAPRPQSAQVLRGPEPEPEPEPELEMSAVARMLAAALPPAAAVPGRETLAQRAVRLKKGREAPVAAKPRAVIAAAAERLPEPAEERPPEPAAVLDDGDEDDDLHAQIMAMGN